MYQAFLARTLEAASEIARRNFGKVTGATKAGDNNQVLTETDLEIGAYIVGQMREQFPGHNVIDEEAGVVDNASDYTWVVDPIDGTSNFAAGVPTYAIMIGLLHGGVPVAGGIALPEQNEIYVAEKGSGATRNEERIAVSKEGELSRTLVAYGIDGHQEAPEKTHSEMALLERLILNIRNLRSSNSAFDMIMVARGGYGGFLNRTSKIWDNVAPHIIIEEAGGVYTDFFGEQMDYSDVLRRADENFTCCAAPAKLHARLQALIHS
ncbi:inositol monophosphatase [Candidatus Saccharibacteria bacterium]|nr:MAG: inositol monophosphatase [Candidatus Saccharibacteria bacterium]